MGDNRSNSGIHIDPIFNNLTIRRRLNVHGVTIVAPIDASSEVPPAGGVAYDTNSGLMSYSTGTKWLPVDQRTSFLFRPGYTGPADSNIFTIWADLIAAMVLVSGPKTIFFDDTLGSIVIPAGGPYDMTDVVWTSVPCRYLFCFLTINDGVTITGLTKIVGLSIFNTTITVATCTFDLLGTQKTFQLVDTTLQSVSGAPFWHLVDSVGGGTAIVYQEGGLLAGVFPEIQADSSLTSARIFLNEGRGGNVNILNNGALAGSANWFIFLESSIAGLTIPFSPANFPAVAGTITFSDSLRVPKIQTAAAAPVAGNDNTQGFKLGDIWVNTAGNVIYAAVDVSTGAAIWNTL